MSNKKSIRQGDLLFVPRDPDYCYNNIVAKPQENGIIQRGEATGHHHKLADPDTAKVYRPDWGMPYVIVGPSSATVIHQEHGAVILEPDTTYGVHIAREYDITQGERQVVD